MLLLKTYSELVVKNAQKFTQTPMVVVQRNWRYVIHKQKGQEEQQQQKRLFASAASRPRRQPIRVPSSSSSLSHEQLVARRCQASTLAWTRRTAGGSTGKSSLSKTTTTTISTARRKKATLSNAQSSSSSQSASEAAGSNLSNNISYFSSAWTLKQLGEYFRRQRTIPIPRWITPGHRTVSFSEVLGHSSFVLVAISYSVDDFVLLRCIAVVGSTAMLFFTYFHPHGRPLWLPFQWNALFIAINGYRVGKVYLDRHNAENLSKEYIQLRDEHFHLMDPVDFARLIRLGKVEDFEQGDILVAQDDDNRYVRLVVSGELEVLRDGKLTYLIEEASFVSESGLHAGIMLPGTVNSCCTVKARSVKAHVLAWDRTELLHLLESNANVSRSLQNAMSWDIVRKLKTQRLLLSSNEVKDPEHWAIRQSEQTQHRYTAILQNFLEHHRDHHHRSHRSKGGTFADGRDQLHNYRLVHHIDDEHHVMALKECGWTVEEFENSLKAGHQTINNNNNKGTTMTTGDASSYFRSRDLSSYLKELYIRIFG